MYNYNILNADKCFDFNNVGTYIVDKIRNYIKHNMYL